MKIVYTVVLIILMSVIQLWAANIDAVVVKGNKRVPSSRVESLIVKQGNQLDFKVIDESVKSIFDTGLFLDVKVDLSVEDEKVTVTYLLKEKPFIGKIFFEGNKDVKEETLREKLKIKENQIFDKKHVEDSIKEINIEYEGRSFYSVKVTYDIEERGNNSVDLIFHIDEGKESLVYKINFEGNSAFREKELKKLIETDEKGLFSWFTGSGKLKRENVALDRERIRYKYMNSGYMKVQVGEPDIAMDDAKKKINVTFRISEGGKYKIGNIDITGNKSVPTSILLEKLSLKSGEEFSSDKFQKDIALLTDQFTEKGYAFANVEPSTDVDDNNLIVNLRYKIDENILVYINRIDITGNSKTRDRIIRREFDISEGELYNSTKIKDSKHHIEYTNFFEEVSLKEEPEGDKMNLKLNIKEKMTGIFSIGAGYSSLDGMVGTIQMTQQNFFGYGYTLNLKAEFSSKRTDYNISFTNPWLFDKNISFGVDLFNLKRSYYEYTEYSTGGALRFGHALIKRKLSMYHKIAYEMKEITDLEEDASQYIVDQQGKFTTVSYTPSLAWNTLNHPIDPTRGNKASTYVKFAGNVLGGDYDYIKAGLEGSQYLPLFWKFVGMVHGEIGYMVSTSNDPLPIDERFRLGGMYSVRGFKYGDISPKDENGYDYGGDKFVQLNLEVTFPIAEEANLKGVVFLDMGQVYDNGKGYFSSDVRKSAGFGFRWYSPIGPLRIEYGYKLDKKEGESADRWDFSIGGMF